MNNNDIREAYDSLTPTPDEKQKMLNAILSSVPAILDRKEIAMKTHKRKPALIAAMVAVTLLLTGCAAVVLGLKDLKMGETPGEEPWDQISLQGFVGSPGYRAAQEWIEYRDSYDPRGDLRIWNNYHHIEMPPEYDAFSCQSQEMMDKLDEICKKYNLTLPGTGWSVLDVSKLFQAVGISGIEAEGSKAELHLENGHCYADGTFSVYGGVHFPSQRVGDMFYMNCTRKGSFHASLDSVSDIDSFDQWYYTLKDGTQVLLSDYGVEVVMIADRKDFFTTIRLYGEGVVYILDQQEKRKAVEAMADCFDFSIQPHAVDEVALETNQQDWDAMWAEGAERNARDYRRVDYQAVMYGIMSYAKDRGQKYAMYDMDGDGIDELLLSVQNGIEAVVTYDGEHTSLVVDGMFMPDLTLCENNVFRSKKELNNCFEYTFWRLQDGKLIPFDFVEYHDEAPAHWGRSQDGDDIADRQIPESEAKQIIDSYKLIELTWKPVEEFPMD